MNSQRIAGVVALGLGIVLILYSMSSMHRISQAKSSVHSLTGTFSNNPVGKMMGNALEDKASQYDTIVMVMLIGGIALACGGGYVTFFHRKKS